MSHHDMVAIDREPDSPPTLAADAAVAALRDPRLVLIVRDTMEATTLHAVAEACARVHAQVHVWEGGPAPRLLPSLVVAALPAGMRQIPAPILELADHRFPGTPVLLACDEPLTRPTITLQAGRLTLVEPPLTLARMVSRLRLLLAEAPGDVGTATPLPPPAPGACECREYRQPRWWAAELACNGRPADHGAVPPSSSLALDQGLTAVLAPRDTRVAPGALERALDIVRHGAHRADDGAALERALGRDIGLLHLTSDADGWIIYWPCYDRPLWLFSPLRLPRWSDLAHTCSSSLWHMPAASGDVVAALSSRALFGGTTAGSASLPPPTEASSAMLDGGPALLDLLQMRLGAAPRPFSCVLAEVR